ncbi:MAG: winged helix-turn-helix transcriptional regulator, partial [Ensifer adhaerens]
MEYDVYIQACPTRMVLDRLADKWAVLVLGRLDDKPVRFNQLKREIDG